MPRAKAFTRSHVGARAQVGLDPKVIDKTKTTLRSAGIEPEQMERVVCRLVQAIQAYKLRVLADSQESPARIVAALRPGLQPAKRLSKWLGTLPQSLRFDLKVPGMEGLPDRIEELVKYWGAKVRAHRPAGEAAAGFDLRKMLDGSLADHIDNERKRRRVVADILRDASIKFPNEKKNRKKFTGRQLRS
jgi:hypothetical protein